VPRAGGRALNRLLNVVQQHPWLSAALLVGPAVAWVALFALVPSVTILVNSFLTRSPTGGILPIFTVSNYARAFTRLVYPTIIWRSILIGIETTAIALLIGYPVAHYLGTKKGRRSLLVLLIIIPFWTSYLIRIFAWVLVLMERGLVNATLVALGVVEEPLSLLYTHFAVVLAIVYSALPFVILPIYAVISGIDERLTEAAKNLGATDWQAFREVTLPLSLPGVVAGGMIAFIFSMGSYLGPVILGGKDVVMVSNTIVDFYFQFFDWPFGSALSLIVVVVIMALTAAVYRVARVDTIYGRR
jgi:spermidine/putrescine transport system permease protein